MVLATGRLGANGYDLDAIAEVREWLDRAGWRSRKLVATMKVGRMSRTRGGPSFGRGRDKVRTRGCGQILRWDRGAAQPANELLGVAYCCTLEDPSAIVVSSEHMEHRWVTPDEAAGLLVASDPSTAWIRSLIERAEKISGLLPPGLTAYHRARGFELD